MTTTMTIPPAAIRRQSRARRIGQCLQRPPEGAQDLPGPCIRRSRGIDVDDSKWERWSALAGIAVRRADLVVGLPPREPAEARATRPPRSPSSSPTSTTSSGGPGFVGALGAVVLLLVPRRGVAGPAARRGRSAAARGGGRAGCRVRSRDGAVGGIVLSVVAIVGVTGTGGQPARASSTSCRRTSVPQVLRHRALRRRVLGRDPADRRVPEVPRAGSARCVALVAARVGGGIVASTRDVFFVLAFVGFVGFTLWLLDRQRDDVPGHRRRGTEAPASAS